MAVLRSSLDFFFHPQSIAVLGASDKAGSVVDILIRNLLENQFGKAVYLIDPSRPSVRDVDCYSNLASVPKKVELAVIASSAATVSSLVQDCVENGVAAAIIAADFAELGA